MLVILKIYELVCLILLLWQALGSCPGRNRACFSRPALKPVENCKPCSLLWTSPATFKAYHLGGFTVIMLVDVWGTHLVPI